MTALAQTDATILVRTEMSGLSSSMTTGEALSNTTATEAATDTQVATTVEVLTETVGVAPEVKHVKKVFPPLDPTTFASQLIWFAIAFGALYLMMSRVALPRIGSVIEERKARIRRDLDEAERLKVETEKALKAYEQAVAEARGNASQIAQQTRDKLKSEIDAERQRIDKEISGQIAKAEAQIKTATTAAMGNVKEIATDTAEAIIGALVGLKLGRGEVSDAVKSVLKH
jgi:F-type H+-transporting ATPase subunit b